MGSWTAEECSEMTHKKTLSSKRTADFQADIGEKTQDYV